MRLSSWFTNRAAHGRPREGYVSPTVAVDVRDIEQLAWSEESNRVIQQLDHQIMESFRDNVEALREQGQDNAVNGLVSSLRRLEMQMRKDLADRLAEQSGRTRKVGVVRKVRRKRNTKRVR